MTPKASTELPSRIISLIEKPGKEWREFNTENLFAKHVLSHWSALIDDWSNDPDSPLIIRKTGPVRGSVTVHETGREVIFCDNSPAQWVAEEVFKLSTPRLSDIKEFLAQDKIPFKFIAKRGEQNSAKYKCVSNGDFNKAGWKLCHIDAVGLNSRKGIYLEDINFLKKKFKLLLDPAIFFILPKSIGGLGEVRWFIDAQR